MAGFDLRRLVEAVLTDASLNDPRQVAAAVYSRTLAEDMPAGYAVALVDYVRNIALGQTRANPILRGAAPRGSARVAAIRDWYARALCDRVFVAPHTWKPLGECTFDDLMSAAARRWLLAGQNMAAAERYERLAKLVEYHGVDTVADLPQGTIGGDDDG